MELNLKDKVVIVTGGTGGIGRQICLDFLIEGALVVCAVRRTNKFNELTAWIEEQGTSITNLFHLECDLLSSSHIQTFIKETLDQFKRIDVLVNCAGAVEEIPFAMMDEKRIGEMIDLNLKATMLMSQGVLRPMFKQKQGSIINISSITAIRGGRGIVAYAAAKAGMDSFTRTLASEVGKKGIRVNGIRPGAIKTSMSEPLESRIQEYIPNAMIMGRFGKPEEVSKGVLFLASEETASFITGSFINIDGGYMV